MHIWFWWKIPEEEAHWEDLDIGGRIILKSIFVR
jgi:hypothetical protein